jgi:hypothetical protein
MWTVVFGDELCLSLRTRSPDLVSNHIGAMRLEQTGD